MSSSAQIEMIIPLASRLVSKDWPETCRMLQHTLASILALPRDFASVSIVGHEFPANLPTVDRCRWIAVNWDPPKREDIPGKLNDKGCKVRLGVQEAYARGAKWVMFADADDLISNRLSDLCDFENHDAICFQNGYSWEVGSDWLQALPKFHLVCGTSWIMRASPRFFPIWLGRGNHRVCDLSHNRRHEALTKEGARIQTIQAPMAIYCVGHTTNTGHGEFCGKILGPSMLHPLQLAKRIIRRKRLTAALRSEFLIPAR